jgi:catechol 2,3-dioxygenase-like lactoylglutathione lyase family enzyme
VATWVPKLGPITLFVDDLEATKQFYRDVFEVPLVFEDVNSAVFDFGNTLVNVLQARQAPELVQPAAVARPDAGSRALLTINVDDVDAVYADLTGRGVTFLNGPMDRPWGVRTAAFADPGGHVWEIAK